MGKALPTIPVRKARDRFPVAGPRTFRRKAADGIEFAVDVYRPAVPGSFPVLLMRLPYGRKIASAVVLAHPAWYAAHGYVVAIEDVRGRGDSGGEFRVLADDVMDGAAALEWAANIAGANGQVATYGFSYQAVNQFLALAGARRASTKCPDAFVSAMAAWSVRSDWAYEGDAFRLALNRNWAAQCAAESARLSGDVTGFERLSDLAGDGSGDRPAAVSPLFPEDVETHFYRWLEDQPETWNDISPASLLSEDPLDVPGLHVGGWLDFMLTGTLAGYAEFAEADRAQQRLLIGPWLHLPWSRFVGAADLGAAAESHVDHEAIGFLDHILKNRGEIGPPVRLFDLGAKRWRDFSANWKCAQTRWYLGSTGLATLQTTDGMLAREHMPDAIDYIVHDPWRPAPITGGHLPPSQGFVDRAGVDQRTDVACYNTEAFARPVTLRGAIRAELAISCDRPSYDVFCTLSVLDRSGQRCITLTSGVQRVATQAEGDRLVVDLRPTYCTIPEGSSLRLSIQAAAYPAFAINPGTGRRPDDAVAGNARTTTLAISTGKSAASSLRLPIA